jgi:hypothetical protein
MSKANQIMQEFHSAVFQTTTIPSALSIPNGVQGAALGHLTGLESLYAMPTYA